VSVTEPQPIIDSYEFSHYTPSNKVYVDGSKTITLVYVKPKPPVGGIIISPEENLAATANNTTIIVLAIAIISTLTIATAGRNYINKVNPSYFIVRSFIY